MSDLFQRTKRKEESDDEHRRRPSRYRPSLYHERLARRKATGREKGKKMSVKTRIYALEKTVYLLLRVSELLPLGSEEFADLACIYARRKSA